MRIRTVKPEWAEDDKMLSVSDAARVMSIAVLNWANDFGRGKAGPSIAKVFITSDECSTKARRSIVELARIGYLTLYKNNSDQYYQVSNWERHQKVDRPGKNLIPGLDDPKSEVISDYDSFIRGIFVEDSSNDRRALATDLGPRTVDLGPYIDLPNGKSHPTNVGVVDSEISKTRKRKPKVKDSNSDIQKIFDTWLAASGRDPNRTKLDTKRRAKIEWALKTYGTEACEECLAGYALSDFHQGNNDRGLKYTDLLLWFRDSKNFETGLSFFEIAVKDHGGNQNKILSKVGIERKPSEAPIPAPIDVASIPEIKVTPTPRETRETNHIEPTDGFDPSEGLEDYDLDPSFDSHNFGDLEPMGSAPTVTPSQFDQIVELGKAPRISDEEHYARLNAAKQAAKSNARKEREAVTLGSIASKALKAGAL